MESLPPYLSGPLIILLTTCFIKLLATLSIMTYGLGLNSSAFNIITIGLSLGLSLLVMSPQIEQSGGLAAILDTRVADEHVWQDRFRPFLAKHTLPDLTSRLMGIYQKLESQPTEPRISTPGDARLPFSVLVGAFLVSELKEAFQLGVIILIPFLVLDLVVVNLLMSLGIIQISAAAVSLPLKILLFVAVDGWTLISEKLIGTYL